MHRDVFLISNLSSAHFVQLCDSRDIPIVFLPNSGDRTAEEAFASDNIMALKERGKMAQCVANARVPKVGQLILPSNPYSYTVEYRFSRKFGCRDFSTKSKFSTKSNFWRAMEEPRMVAANFSKFPLNRNFLLNLCTTVLPMSTVRGTEYVC